MIILPEKRYTYAYLYGMKKFKEPRRKYNITLEDIAKWFGYASTSSLKNSTAKDTMLQGVDKVIQYVEREIINRIDS